MADERVLTCVVTDKRIKRKYCVEVYPVDCFSQSENMLVIQLLVIHPADGWTGSAGA